MSFDIYASGTDDYRYSKSGNIDGDDFSAADVLSKIAANEPTATGAVGAAVDIGVPSGNIADGVAGIARGEFLHIISSSLSLMQTRPLGGAAITVSCRNKHTFWPDTVSTRTYGFSPGDAVGAEFFKAIRPALTDTDLDTWGVLAALARVCADFENNLDEGSVPRLVIWLTH